MEVEIPPVNWLSVPFDATVTFLGSRGSGKTTNCKIAMRDMASNVYRNIVYCGNPDNLVEWGEILPDCFVGLFDVNHLRKVLLWQKERYFYVRKQWSQAGHQLKDFVCPHWLRLRIVFEDVGFGDIYKSKELAELVFNARHFGVGLSMIAQYYSQLPKQLRSNQDYLALTTLSQGIEEIYNRTLKSFFSFKNFMRILTFCIRKKGDMVLFHLQGASSDLTSIISYRESVLQRPFLQISPPQSDYYQEYGVGEDVRRWLAWKSRKGHPADEPKICRPLTRIEERLLQLEYVAPLFGSTHDHSITIEDKCGESMIISRSNTTTNTAAAAAAIATTTTTTTA